MVTPEKGMDQTTSESGYERTGSVVPAINTKPSHVEAARWKGKEKEKGMKN